MKNVKSVSEKLKEWIESKEGEEYFKNSEIKHQIKLKRFTKLEKYILENGLDILIERLISEHDDEYVDKCYSKGVEPYPNNKMEFLFDYFTNKYQTIEVESLNDDFPNAIWCFGGYYFQIIWGQGAIYRIYRKSNMNLLLQI